MLYKKILDANISRLVLGSALFGTAVTEEKSFAIMRKYFDFGGNTIDTARVYGSWNNNSKGASERTVGKFLKENDLRNKAYILTKAGHPLPESMLVPRLSKEEIISDVEESLIDLGIDAIDALFLHRDDESRSVGEIMETLNLLIKQGKVKTIGVSNWKNSRVLEANQYAEENNLDKLVGNELEYSFTQINSDFVTDPLCYHLEDDERIYCNENDFPVFAYSSQASGLFYFIEKANGDISKLPEFLTKKFINAETLNKLNKVIAIAKQYGISYTAASVGLILRENRAICPIIGPTEEEHLIDSLSALKLFE